TFRLRNHESIIEQGLVEASIHLEHVFETLQRALNDACWFFAGLAPLNQAASQFGVADEIFWELRVALKLELLDGKQSISPTWVTRNEYELARLRSFGTPWEIIRCSRRRTVFVDAQQTEIERPAGEVEVVGITAKCRNGMLRREHHAHVIVALVLVEEVLTALV